LKWILIAAGALVLLVAGALAVLPWLVDAPRVQAYVAQAASQALGRPVRFASLSVSAFPTPGVRLKGLQVGEDPRFGNQPFLVVDEGRFRLRLRPLLSGRVELTDLTLEKLRVEIIDDAGRLNVASLGPAPAAGRPAPRAPAGAVPAAGAAATISQVRIKDSVVHFVRRGAQGLDARLEGLDLLVRPAGDTFTLEGSARLAPGGLRVKLTQATLTMPPGRALGEAPLRATVEVSGADVGALVRGFAAAPEMRGPVEAKLRVAGTVAQPTAQGDLAFSGLTLSERRPQCPPPPVRQLQLGDVRVPITLSPARVDAAPLTARVAGGTVSLRAAMPLASSSPTVILRDIALKGVELEPLLVGYLCQGYAVTGPLEFAGEAFFATRDPMRTAGGAGRLRVGKGRVVGAAALGLVRDVIAVAGLISPLAEGKPRAAPTRPLDFESITATYRITNGVVATDDLVYQGEGLTGNVAGTYGLADGRIDAAVTLTQGRTQVKARVTGTAGEAVRVIPTGITQGGRDAVKELLERLLR
jgi:hypothetical protein